MSQALLNCNHVLAPQPPSHTTIPLSRITLQFESTDLELCYRAYSRKRRRLLLLRSLVPSALFQLLFFISDYVTFPHENLRVTVAVRVLLAALQLCLFGLTKLNLLQPRQRVVFFTTLLYGLSSLTLFGLQREHLGQLEGLYLLFGLAFYAVPKVCCPAVHLFGWTWGI